MLMILNLLSQPVQAISFGFSFANLDGQSPTGADRLVTGIIDGLVEGNNPGTSGIIAHVTSTPNGNLLIGDYTFNSRANDSSPYAFVVTSGQLVLANATFQSSARNFILATTDNTNTGQAYYYPDLGDGTFFDRNANSLTFTSATAVPWETDALSVIGSTIVFGFGLWAKQKFAKPLQK